jgi:hypothetical protein
MDRYSFVALAVFPFLNAQDAREFMLGNRHLYNALRTPWVGRCMWKIPSVDVLTVDTWRNVQSIEFLCTFEAVRMDNLPPRLTYLDLDQTASQPFATLPQGLTFLALPYENRHPLQLGMFGANLVRLHLGNMFNHALPKNVLPPNLQHLYVGAYFNQVLEPGVFPDSLKTLHLGHYYNRPIELGVLPLNLQELRMNWYFNHKLDVGVLPKTLVFLSMGSCFDQDLEPGVFPNGLCVLMMGDAFEHQIFPEVLPLSLRELHVGPYYDKPVPTHANLHVQYGSPCG